MKDYFNATERGFHLAILACQGMAARFRTETSALSEEEERQLKAAERALKRFNESVFDRFGEAYRRKLLATLESNDLKLVGKYEPCRDAISQAVSDDMLPKLRELQSLNCWECDKDDHLGCAMYAMGVTCGLEDKNEHGCPFRL